MSEQITEDGIAAGNAFDKYGSKNPLYTRLQAVFEKNLFSLIEKAAPANIYEFGCGEGHWSIKLALKGYNITASDFSKKIIKVAKKNAEAYNVDSEIFSVRSVYESTGRSDLVLAVEVLEHLEQPDEALECIAKIASPWFVCSVPNEPLWRILNMCRGKYLGALDNTPGHVQHWNYNSFIKMLKRRFEVVETAKPFPWLMALCKTKS